MHFHLNLFKVVILPTDVDHVSRNWENVDLPLINQRIFMKKFARQFSNFLSIYPALNNSCSVKINKYPIRRTHCRIVREMDDIDLDKIHKFTARLYYKTKLYFYALM